MAILLHFAKSVRPISAGKQGFWRPVLLFFGYICRYRKALYSGSLGISLYLELFCFLSFISFVLRKLT